MRGLVSNLRFTFDAESQTQAAEADVFFTGLAAPSLSSVRVPINGSESVNVLGANLLAAVQAEAARLGLGVPTDVLSPAFVKLK